MGSKNIWGNLHETKRGKIVEFYMFWMLNNDNLNIPSASFLTWPILSHIYCLDRKNHQRCIFSGAVCQAIETLGGYLSTNQKAMLLFWVCIPRNEKWWPQFAPRPDPDRRPAAWQGARARIVKTDKIKMGHNQQQARTENRLTFINGQIAERSGDHFT